MKGTPLTTVERLADEYAMLGKTRDALDTETLRVIDGVDREIYRAIVSTNYGRLIRKELDLAGFEETFDDVVANCLRTTDDMIDEFDLSVVSDKGRVVRDLLSARDISYREAAFIGDGEDDIPALDLVENPIVPWRADAAFIERCARRYGDKLRAAENHDELQRILQSL